MKISDMDYYRGLFEMQAKTTDPSRGAAINGEINKLMTEASLKYTGVHVSGANEYRNEAGVRSYIHDQKALENAFNQGFLSKSDVAGGTNAITWQKTGTTANGQNIDKLITGNKSTPFDFYQVGDNDLAFKYKNPDGSSFIVPATKDPRAKAAGYAVPDAASQEVLMNAANQNLTEYIKASTASTREVDSLSTKVSQFGQVKGDTWSSRMGEYYSQMTTASAGSQALQTRNSLENTAANYGENYMNSMRGVSANSAGSVQLSQTSALVDMARANRESVAPSANYQKQFDSAYNSAAFGAVKDSYETGKQTLSSMATSVSQTANSYASSAWNYMSGGGSASSKPSTTPGAQTSPSTPGTSSSTTSGQTSLPATGGFTLDGDEARIEPAGSQHK